MTSSHNSYDEFSTEIARQWLMRELEASHKELYRLNLLLSYQKHNFEFLRTSLFIQMASLTEKIIQLSHGNYNFDLLHELEEIDRELKDIYKIDDFDSYDITDFPSPRVKFLVEKRQYLLALKNNAAMIIPKENTGESAHSEKKGLLKVAFDIGKKFIDLIDDVWAAMRNILSHKVIETVGPILVGSTGFLIHLGEGYEGAKLAYGAYRNEKIGQRTTRIVTGALTFALAGAGVGMGLALLATSFGASIAAAPLLPVLIPSALTAIYGLSLWRQSYIFHRTKEEENKAHNTYQQALAEIQPAIEDLQERMNQLAVKGKLSEKELADERRKIDQNCSILRGSIEGLRRNYELCREKRLQAERDVAFTTVEVAASTMVLLGIILGTAAVVGASIGTFGIAPLALIITGVVTGAGSKVFEARDEKNHHAYTSAIRKFFVNLWEKVVSPAKKLEVEKAPAPLPVAFTSTHKDEPPAVSPSIVLSAPAQAEEIRLRPAPADSRVSVTQFSQIVSHTKVKSNLLLAHGEEKRESLSKSKTLK